MKEQSIGPVEKLVRSNGPRRRNVLLASAPLALARFIYEMNVKILQKKRIRTCLAIPPAILCTSFLIIHLPGSSHRLS